jgi:hypothetical protein
MPADPDRRKRGPDVADANLNLEGGGGKLDREADLKAGRPAAGEVG